MGNLQHSIRLERFKHQGRAQLESQNRSLFWQQCLRIDCLREDENQDLFNWLLQLPLDDGRVVHAEACIQKDLDRVFPHCFGQGREEYRQKKYSVLLAYAKRCPDVGYEPGIHFIAGVLLAVMDAEKAFWCLCSIVERMLPSGFFCANPSGRDHDCRTEIELFHQLLCTECPDLAAHLGQLQVDVTLFLTSWFKTFFMCLEATHCLKFRILDSIFQNGVDGLHHVALWLLKTEKSRFLLCRDFEEAVQLLHVLPIDGSCSFLDPLPAIQGLREASGRGQGKPLAVRSYSLAWSPGIHFRTPRRLQRVVLLLLMAQRRPGAVARLPKALWIDRILPLL